MIATLLDFIRGSRNGENYSRSKADPGFGTISEAEHFASPGDDGAPMAGDLLTLVPNLGGPSGQFLAIGYIDPKMQAKASAGEKRVYARNSSGGLIAEIWLKNSGEVVVSNDNGSITLEPNGDIDANGAKLKAGGVLECTAIDCNKITTLSAAIAGVEHAAHTHTVATVAGPTTPTTPPVGPPAT